MTTLEKGTLPILIKYLIQCKDSFLRECEVKDREVLDRSIETVTHAEVEAAMIEKEPIPDNVNLNINGDGSINIDEVRDVIFMTINISEDLQEKYEKQIAHFKETLTRHQNFWDKIFEVKIDSDIVTIEKVQNSGALVAFTPIVNPFP